MSRVFEFAEQSAKTAGVDPSGSWWGPVLDALISALIEMLEDCDWPSSSSVYPRMHGDRSGRILRIRLAARARRNLRSTDLPRSQRREVAEQFAADSWKQGAPEVEEAVGELRGDV